MIPSIETLTVVNKCVFIRADLNVPISEQGTILDDTKIRASLPTLRYLLEQGARVVLASHLGRPDGDPNPHLSLAPVGHRLAELLYPLISELSFSEQPTSDGTRKLIRELEAGQLLLLENLRFDPREEANDETFAKELARDVDLYVNDAFASSHRAHASVVGMVRYVPEKAAGFLLLREVQMLSQLLGSVERPYVAILGGKKIDDKIGVIDKLLGRIQSLLVGGAMSHPFLRAQGTFLGKSSVEEHQVTMAKNILERAQKARVEIVLPVDAVISSSLKTPNAISVPLGAVSSDSMVLDIGQKTIERFRSILQPAKTIFWNGPMGAYEYPPFDRGTKELANILAFSKGFTVVGGGDSIAALQATGLASKISHVSTGGGASLEFIEGKTLPGLAVLETPPPRTRGASS